MQSIVLLILVSLTAVSAQFLEAFSNLLSSSPTASSLASSLLGSLFGGSPVASSANSSSIANTLLANLVPSAISAVAGNSSLANLVSGDISQVIGAALNNGSVFGALENAALSNVGSLIGANLNGLTSLSCLTGLSNGATGALGCLTALTALNGLLPLISNATGIAGLTALTSLRGLTALSALTGLTNGNLGALSSLTSVLPVLTKLGGLTQLSGLSVLTGLGQLGALTGLTNCASGVSNCIGALSALSGLTALNGLASLVGLNSSALSELGALTGLAGLTGLTGLTALTNGLSGLTGLQSLTALNGLSNFGLANGDFSALTALTGLTGLANLANGDLSGLTSLGSLAGLSGLLNGIDPALLGGASAAPTATPANLLSLFGGALGNLLSGNGSVLSDLLGAAGGASNSNVNSNLGLNQITVPPMTMPANQRCALVRPKGCSAFTGATMTINTDFSDEVVRVHSHALNANIKLYVTSSFLPAGGATYGVSLSRHKSGFAIDVTPNGCNAACMCGGASKIANNAGAANFLKAVVADSALQWGGDPRHPVAFASGGCANDAALIQSTVYQAASSFDATNACLNQKWTAKTFGSFSCASGNMLLTDEAMQRLTASSAMSFNGGEIAAVVIFSVVVLALCVGVAVCLVRNRRNAAARAAAVATTDGDASLEAMVEANPGLVGTSPIDMRNAVYHTDSGNSNAGRSGTTSLPVNAVPMSGATVGQPRGTTSSGRAMTTLSGAGAPGVFACTVCGNTYNFASDLQEHTALRHP